MIGANSPHAAEAVAYFRIKFDGMDVAMHITSVEDVEAIEKLLVRVRRALTDTTHSGRST